MKNIDFLVLEMQCLFMDKKVNYYQKSLQILDGIEKTGKDPTFRIILP